MEIFYGGIILLGVIITSTILVYLVKNHTLKAGILDIPNERSSHQLATPRGGGLGFVITFLFILIALSCFSLIEPSIGLALIGGGSVVGAIGWLDDKTGLNARVRALFHFMGAIWAVICLGGFSSLSIGFAELNLSWIGSMVAVIGIVWMINLYNFMDGIDGIAGTEAVCVAVIGGLFISMYHSYNSASICFLLAASVAGFLLWNWPPAKIFMGDVGSGFLGFIFAVIAMWSEQSGGIPFIAWIMLLGVFVIDATVTLIRRVAKREKWHEAHRSHVYQLAVQAGYSHKQVTVTVLVLTLMVGLITFWALAYQDFLLWIGMGEAVFLIIVHFFLGKKFNRIINRQEINQISHKADEPDWENEAAAIVETID